MTVKAVALGMFLALVFGAANAYLGMKAGQTVSATIPAAVIAMALFRIKRIRGGILEQNIARTSAAVGEALVAAAIFTIPSFMLVEMDGHRLWSGPAQPLLGSDINPAGGRLNRCIFYYSIEASAGGGSRSAVARERRERGDRQGRAGRKFQRVPLYFWRDGLRRAHPDSQER